MGEKVRLIDSAIETAQEIKTILENLSLIKHDSHEVIREFYVTDSADKFISVGERFLGRTIDYIQKIELDSEV